MRNIKQFESFSKEKEINDICEKYNIKDYTINDDLSIDVKVSVSIDYNKLTELPLVFNIVEGDFWCDNNKLTSLKGAPKKCKKLYCNNNSLSSLKFISNECNNIYCYSNPNLRSLKYIPNIEYIDIDKTAISSFEHLPNSFRISPNVKLRHICELIYVNNIGDVYMLDEIELFNDYRIIDDKDYVNNKADKATLNMFKLKDFLEELKIDKEIDVKELEKHFYIK